MDSSLASPGPESPPVRTTILGSFLRGRRHSNSQLNPPPLSPSLENGNPFGNGHSPALSGSPQPGAIAHSSSSTGAFSGMLALRRRRSGGQLNGAVGSSPHTATPPPVPGLAPPTAAAPATPSVPPASITRAPTAATPGTPGAGGAAHRIRLVPHLESRRSLRFDAITRDVREGDAALRIGRFTDRSGGSSNAANALGSNKLAFKSKVVSRTHAEIWTEAAGKFYIRDTKSSSGTFLNHIRLSPANSESRPHELRDGDILQLGVDYQGGAEDIYKCVKIRIEVGREWQSQANAFNTNALKQLKSLAVDLTKSKEAKDTGKKASTKTGMPDCCICLFAVSIQQALFIAPCSHAFHYKCLRPLLDSHYPAFVCPLCRTFADLEADVEVEDGEEWPDADEPAAGEGPHGAKALSPGALGASISRRDGDDAMDTDVEARRHALGGLPEADEDMAEGTDGERAAMARIARGGSVSPSAQMLSEEEGEFLAAVDAMDVVRVRGAGPSGLASGSEEEGVVGDATLAGKRKR